MIIKLCGIRRTEDVDFLNEFLPDYAGFVMAESKRKVTLEELIKLKSKLSPKIKSVGVFVNADFGEINKASQYLDVIQLHGDEGNDYISQLKCMLPEKEIWKAVRVTDENSIIKAEKLPCDKLLLDSFSSNSYGGTGKTADWGIINNSGIKKPFFLAGGLNIENIETAIKEVKPTGVDISSGIETDGEKDRLKIRKIINIIRGVN